MNLSEFKKCKMIANYLLYVINCAIKLYLINSVILYESLSGNELTECRMKQMLITCSSQVNPAPEAQPMSAPLSMEKPFHFTPN